LKDYCQEQYKGPKIEQIVGLQQMANGLAYIHSNRFVHRDIKPANILYQLNEASNSPLTFKISDFGFVKMTSEEGTFYQSGIKGTAHFMAPEKLDDEEFFQKGTQAADVFAMGCVFYYFCTNDQHPFGKRYSITVNIIKNKNDISGIYIH
jgi:serine/threonine protein kinase